MLDGRSRFIADPLELSTKIPDPEGFIAPALWMSEEHHETRFTVTGRASYTLQLVARDTWKSQPPPKNGHDLEDFAGVITGREVVRFLPPTPPEQLGLAHPALTAVLCTDDHGCRTFRFGEHMIVALTGVPSSLRFLNERFR